MCGISLVGQINLHLHSVLICKLSKMPITFVLLSQIFNTFCYDRYFYHLFIFVKSLKLTLYNINKFLYYDTIL